ncbi:MAG: sulfurtransferase TusA family protein [Candidatus Omnitrophota bacterium]
MTKIKVDLVLDLKNTPCPINFVKTKLKLEQMNKGEVLEVLLDDGDPITNVTVSVKEDGHQILKVEKINDHWKLVVKKVGE